MTETTVANLHIFAPGPTPGQADMQVANQAVPVKVRNPHNPFPSVTLHTLEITRTEFGHVTSK